MSDQLTLFNQLGLTPAIDEIKHSKIEWSYSRRETFDRCLRQYYYQYYGAKQRTAKDEPYKDKLNFLKELSNRHLRIGKIIHIIIKTHLNNLQKGERWSLSYLSDWASNIYQRDLEYSKKFQSGYLPDEDKYPPVLLSEFYYKYDNAEALWMESRERLLEALGNFIKNSEFERFRLGVTQPKAIVERLFHLKQEYFSISGQIDLAYNEKGRIVVADWKIGGSNDNDDCLQLLSYALWAKDNFKCFANDINLYIVHLGNNSISHFEVDERKLLNVKAYIIQDIERMQSLDIYGCNAIVDVFTPCGHSKICDLCSFRELCLKEG